MALCTITGFVYMPNGQPAADRLFKFKPARKSIVADYFGAVVPEVIEATTNELGFLTVELLTGNYVAFSALYNGPVVVPDAEEASLYEVFGGTGSVTPPDIAPNFTVLPSLLGSTSLGGTITVDLGAASGVPAPVITGTLTRPGASPVAVTQGQLITVQAGDQGGSLSLTASATNRAGVDTETVSRAIPAAIPAPVFTTPLADVVLTVGDDDVVTDLDDNTENATSYSVSPAGGAVTISGSIMTTSAAAPVDQLYVVTATGPGGTATDSFGVLVEELVRPEYLGAVATGARISTATSTTNKQFNSRSHHVARDTISGLRIEFPAWWWQRKTSGTFTQYREHPAGGPITYSAAIEYPEGTFTPVLFGGVASAAVAGGGSILSDMAAVSIPNGASFWVRTYSTSAWGIIFEDGDSGVTTVIDKANGEAMEYAASGVVNKTMGGTIVDNNAAAGPIFRPTAVVAMTRQPTFLFTGDSKAWGFGDTPTAGGDAGELERLIGPNYGYINTGSSGDWLDTFRDFGTRRAALQQYVSHVVVQAAINSLRSGGAGQAKTAAAVLAEQQQVLALFPTKGRIVTTTAPQASSSNSYVDQAGQTVNANSAQIIAFNDAVRAGVANVIGYIDLADAAESTRNSGKWKTDGTVRAFTTDGLHATPLGYQQVNSLELPDLNYIP